MITKNARQIFYGYTVMSTQYLTNVNGSSAGINATSGSGYALVALCGGYPSDNSPLSLNQGYCTLDVGFGDTPESVDDYNLADPNYTNAPLTKIATAKNATSIGDIFSVYSNFKNNGNTNVVVKEVGVFANPCYNNSSGGNYTCLMFRKVLETPVTIAPGETYVFSYNVRFKS